jgi:adenine-specific DNA methylase
VPSVDINAPFKPSDGGGIIAPRSRGVYGVHAYHTKVPPEAIAACLEEFSEPGDLVLDPFCGSGMTGVAAGLTGRRAFLADLSPAAAHIASNYTSPCDPAAFQTAVEKVLEAVGERVASMYETDVPGGRGVVEYLVWSDIRRCPSCGAEQSLWDHRKNGLRRIRCRTCGDEAAKTEMDVVGEVAVEANISGGGRKRLVRDPIPADLAEDRIPNALPWIPSVRFDAARPMWRRGHQDMGIASVADFYSRRNLAAMSLLWAAASREDDPRLRSALRFSLTAIANRASRRYQWNAKRPTNVLGGTLYVSSLRYEWNVLSLWRRKVRAVERLFQENQMPPGAVEVHRGSATALPLPAASVDYCFTDPPFGGHIVYSDSSLLWEAWLDELTEVEEEAIVVRGGGSPKSIEDYRRLLGASFAEVARVLKPDGLTTVVFQASDPEVWTAVQGATRDAGLSLFDATTLDKGQPSFKQVKGMQGEQVATMDVVLTLRKGRELAGEAATTPLEAAHRAILQTRAAGREATTGRVFASVNARLLLQSEGEALGLAEVSRLLEENFTQRGQAWDLVA